jgi:hypothetical protein
MAVDVLQDDVNGLADILGGPALRSAFVEGRHLFGDN